MVITPSECLAFLYGEYLHFSDGEREAGGGYDLSGCQLNAKIILSNILALILILEALFK